MGRVVEWFIRRDDEDGGGYSSDKGFDTLCVLWFYLSPTKQKKKWEEIRFNGHVKRGEDWLGIFKNVALFYVWFFIDDQIKTNIDVRDNSVVSLSLWQWHLCISCGCKVFTFFVIPHVDPSITLFCPFISFSCGCKRVLPYFEIAHVSLPSINLLKDQIFKQVPHIQIAYSF